MPQVVLQSVFLLRYTASAEGINDTFSLAVVTLSIVASILSIANKYAWFDEQAVVVDAKELNGGRKASDGLYCSWRFLLRLVWRWSDLCVRFIIFSLLWVVVGGVFILIYLIIIYIVYYYMTKQTIKIDDEGKIGYRTLATTICIVGMFISTFHSTHHSLVCLVHISSIDSNPSKPQ